MAKKNLHGLGRGLGALLGDMTESEAPAKPSIVAEPEAPKSDAVAELPINKIDPNRDQARKRFNEEALLELSRSIEQVGVVQPIVVCPNGDRYTIIAGERRFRASRMAGKETIPAVDPTCTAIGNIEYWYCDVCGMAWLDEACTLNTNQFAVKLPVAEHTYDNDFDADCNGCGAIREVATFPVPEIGKSISEDVNGYAVLFDANVEGLEMVDGAADYTTATYEGYKLLGLGVIASNGTSETNIEGVRVWGINDETGALQFAFRVINIPTDKLDVKITMVPYYVVEIDGVATTIEGEAVVGSYAEIAG